GQVAPAPAVQAGAPLPALARPLGRVLGDLAVLLQAIDAVDLVAADVADRDPRLLRRVADQPHVVAPALLGEGRDRDPDDAAVGGRVQAQLGRAEGLLYRPDLAAVVDVDEQHPRLGRADLGQLVEGRRGAVVGDQDLVDRGRVGAA